MRTIAHSDPIPLSLGAWDRSPRALMAQGAEEHEAPTVPRKQQLLSCFKAAIEAGDASAVATFSKPCGKEPDTLAMCVWEGLELAGLKEELAQLLIGLHKRGDVLADLLLSNAAASWCKQEAEYQEGV